jgi:hypothetical protein
MKNAIDRPQSRATNWMILLLCMHSIYAVQTATARQWAADRAARDEETGVIEGQQCAYPSNYQRVASSP